MTKHARPDVTLARPVPRPAAHSAASERRPAWPDKDPVWIRGAVPAAAVLPRIAAGFSPGHPCMGPHPTD
jgi:hypothetical protein